MSAISVSVALSDNPMTAPIHAGKVTPQGVDWTPSAIHPSELFWRQLRFGDFDISEMSLSSLIIAASQGEVDWVAIPVFTTRRFFHIGVMVAEGAGIETPVDLVGRRVGVPEYQQTAAVWTRGALLHEFGVHPEQLRWFMERPPSMSHGGATSFSPPPGVELSYIPTETNMAELLERGELDAALHYVANNNLVDRSRTSAGAIRGVRTLFPDPAAEGARYYGATGILPVNHVVVIRRELHDSHPWIALNVYAAFLEAKKAALAPLDGLLEPWRRIGVLPREVSAQLAATDPLPYGLRGQASTLETLGDYLVEQRLISRPPAIEDLFAKSTLEL